MKNSNGWKKLRTLETKQIEALLKKDFPGWSVQHPPAAYRYNPASIRVRLVSNRFRGKNRLERKKMVLSLLHQLPEETWGDIMILALLAPNELDRSPLNCEFEHPSPAPI